MSAACVAWSMVTCLPAAAAGAIYLLGYWHGGQGVLRRIKRICGPDMQALVAQVERWRMEADVEVHGTKVVGENLTMGETGKLRPELTPTAINR